MENKDLARTRWTFASTEGDLELNQKLKNELFSKLINHGVRCKNETSVNGIVKNYWIIDGSHVLTFEKFHVYTSYSKLDHKYTKCEYVGEGYFKVYGEKNTHKTYRFHLGKIIEDNCTIIRKVGLTGSRDKSAINQIVINTHKRSLELIKENSKLKGDLSTCKKLFEFSQKLKREAECNLEHANNQIEMFKKKEKSEIKSLVSDINDYNPSTDSSEKKIKALIDRNRELNLKLKRSEEMVKSNLNQNGHSSKISLRPYQEDLVVSLRKKFENPNPIVVSGCIIDEMHKLNYGRNYGKSHKRLTNHFHRQIKFLVDLKDSLIEDNKKLLQRAIDLEKELDEHKEALFEKDSDLKKCESRLQKFVLAYKSSSKIIKELQREIDILKMPANSKDQTNYIKNLENSIKELECELEGLNEEKKEFESTQIYGVVKENNSLKSENEKLKREIEGLNDKADHLNDVNFHNEIQIADLNFDKEQLEKKYNELMKIFTSFKNELESLRGSDDNSNT